MPEEQNPDHEEDVYQEADVEEERKNDEISSEEAGFMEGYDRDEEKSAEKKDDVE